MSKFKDLIGEAIARVEGADTQHRFASLDHLIKPLHTQAQRLGVPYSPIVRLAADIEGGKHIYNPDPYRPPRRIKGKRIKHNDWPLHLDAATVRAEHPHVATIALWRFTDPSWSTPPVDVVDIVTVRQSGEDRDREAVAKDMAWAWLLQEKMSTRRQAADMLRLWLLVPDEPRAGIRLVDAARLLVAKGVSPNPNAAQSHLNRWQTKCGDLQLPGGKWNAERIAHYIQNRP